MAALLADYEVPGASIELHAKDLTDHLLQSQQAAIEGFGGMDRHQRRVVMLEARRLRIEASPKGGRGAIARKHRATDSLVHLTWPERNGLFEAALDLVGDSEGVTLFAEVVDKAPLLRRTGALSATRHAFEQIASRFDMFLTRRSRTRRGESETGILVMDRDAGREGEMREMLEQFRGSGHTFGQVRAVIDAPFFVESEWFTGIQLADICGYAVRRHVERGHLREGRDLENMRRIFHKFDREGPRLHGARHYCEPESCMCLICLERRHAVGEQPQPTLFPA